ncbi:uncharacterized protein [Rutidosis leptorrhynchoides]|uniref:uncharacterized protein isoform X3 n=1 Tax=Rutidosis leptorrhynchoides TaxID=125765 RepID=UPI003A99B4A0
MMAVSLLSINHSKCISIKKSHREGNNSRGFVTDGGRDLKMILSYVDSLPTGHVGMKVGCIMYWTLVVRIFEFFELT